MNLGRADVSFDLLRVASADNRAGHGRISKRPGDCYLPGRTSMAIPDFSQAFNKREILRKLRIMKLNVPTSPITRWEIRGAFTRHCAGEQSRRHRRINDHADPARSTVRQNLWFDFPAN